MHLDEPRARIGHRGGAISRIKNFALKGIIVLGGALMLASAVMVSLVFLAIGLAIVLIFGGYLWWKTRDLRKQMRARMQQAQQGHQFDGGRVIEGEVISREEIRR